jgi:glycosyltransferase involved in cell wall biosynthesis/2-polyprenyl-3-methyl-5-hydroxy-6-metoxy-1,4-benzoquinol methylase
MSAPANERPAVKTCHVCEGTRIYYLFSAGDYRVVRCTDCGLVLLNPQPSDEELARIYNAEYFLGSESEEGRRAAAEIKQATARGYLSEISRYRGSATGRLLEVGCGDGDFLELAEAAGWDVTGIEFSPAATERARGRLKKGRVHCGELVEASLAADQFDLCVVSDVLEHVRSPLGFLREIHRLLKPGGILFVTTHSVESWSSRSLRQHGLEFKAGYQTYFDDQTLQTALFKSGFREIVIEAGNMAFAQRTETRSKPMLSVIVPAYNEVKTFGTLLDRLLRKTIPGLDIEVIIVESNSTDGTRELAASYQSRPNVKVIFEDHPRGKGHAVRTGFQMASGDYVLIQDADLEYDLEDYDALLEPLVAGRTAFVLGSRHGGRNVLKMRQFAGEHGLSVFFNFGHWFFTTLLNVLYLQRLRDPFTMFKVFRRDCLCGLEFQCDGFDFDFELLIKLILKGYQPVELPVNYRSRSFKEGKKVRMFRDPLTWLKALGRLRFAKINPLEVVERARAGKRSSTPPASP